MLDTTLPVCALQVDIPMPTAHKQIAALRHRPEGVQPCLDLVAEEYPVALVYNGISHAVMMATPCDLEAFAIGFTLSEGIVPSLREIYDVEVLFQAEGVEVQITIAQSAFAKLKAHRRTLTGRTGCGVCGTESLKLLDIDPDKITSQQIARPDSATIQCILADLPLHQPLMQATGCAHAAAWCSAEGEILRVFEDVGRHNAMDKLLGWMAQSRIDPAQGLVFLTSRASYELVQKAARCNLPVLATISAPTALAVQMAQGAGIHLLSFCRNNGFVEYPA